MACRYREELVGKRFISVRSPQKLKIQKISEWEWRSGVVRAVSSKDTSSLDLSVLIEFDDIDWTRREWVRVQDIFQLFLVEHTLVWAERPDPDKPRQSLSWPGLSFRAVVDKAGLLGCKRKPVEFLVDRFLGLVEEKEIQIFQEGDENSHPTAFARREVQLSLKEWLDYQDGQKILLTTPTVLVGYRLEVYRAEGTTQWYTAVIQSYNHSSKTLSVTDDTVLEEHNEDPMLIQMHLIDDGVVDSILRGVDIGGIAPRRRPRAVKQDKDPQNTTTRTSISVTHTPTSSRCLVPKKSRTLLPPPATSCTPVVTSSITVGPSPPIQPQSKTEVKGLDNTSNTSVKQKASNSKDKKRKVEAPSVTENFTSKKKTKAKLTPNKTNIDNTQVPETVSNLPVRISPRNTPAKERIRPQRNRERDKEVEGETEKTVNESSGKKTQFGIVKSDSDIVQSKSKTSARSRQKKEDKVELPSLRSIDSPRNHTESLRCASSSPRRRSLSRTPVETEAESVIKSISGSSKRDKKLDKSDKKVSNSAKTDKSDLKSELPTSRSVTENPGSSKIKPSDNLSNAKEDSDLVEEKVKEIKSALRKKEKESGIVNITGEVKERKSPRTARLEKETRRKDKKTENECSQVKTTNSRKSVDAAKRDCIDKEKTLNESGDNMHYIKKKQSLLTGGTSLRTPQNSAIPTNIDFNQSVTDQITRAGKLSSLNSDEKASCPVPSTLSSPVSEQEGENHLLPRDNKNSGGSLNSSLQNSNTNSSWSQDERCHSRNSDSRCSSGLSGDETHRPASRVDDLKSTKSSTASSPLIVDKSEPVQIYRDPELMSKNPVRSNVPSMHNPHKSYPQIHNPIPTQASRPASVGMTSSTSLSSAVERTSRTPVMPSVGYPSPLQMATSIPGASLSSLLPPGLHQLDPTTLAIHQQIAAVQQQHVAAALAASEQYRNALSMSYPPPRGSMNKSQLEHLWQQKYPSVPVPPPWLLAKHQEDLVREARMLHEQEHLERERLERIERERERDLREREQHERKERERRERERLEKERIDRERREREKVEQERAAERLEREKQEKERLEREHRDRLDRERRILKESVDSHAAVDQHFSESLRLASQRNWKKPPNQNTNMDGFHYPNYPPKYMAAQTGMWPQPSITLGTGKPKAESQLASSKMGEIKPEEKIKQEQLRETDYRYAEMMRTYKELMSQQEEYTRYQTLLAAGDNKLDVKPEPRKDMGPGGPYDGHTVKREPSSILSNVKQEVQANFSLYGYKPEKYSFITSDQLQSYELEKVKTEKAIIDSKLTRSQSPRKKDLSIPPPLIKDSKPYSSVIVENKTKDGNLKSASPQYTTRMSPHHQPKPAHTPERPHSSSSSPGVHGISPMAAHSQHVAVSRVDASRQGASRSQSPLRIASPQQLSAAVMEPMDYRCSPNVNKTRGTPSSNSGSHPSGTNSSGSFSPAIAQPPVSLPQSSVPFTYSLIQQGLVPNPIYSNSSGAKNCDSQRTVSVTGTAQVPRAAQSPNTAYREQIQQQSVMVSKRKGQKESNNRKRQKGGDVQTQPAVVNNPMNLSVPCTTPQIVSNQSPYTTSSDSVPTSVVTTTLAGTPPTSSPQAEINNRLHGFTGFMDSFKSFVENTVQNAFMSDPELSKHKEKQMKKPANTEELLDLHQHHLQQQHLQQQLMHKPQPYKPKTSLERSSTPVTSQPATQNEDTSNLSNSGTSHSGMSYVESINRVANGQIDTDSDTLSAPSPPPHLKQENTPSPHKAAKHPNLKKAWLQRHSDEDKQETKPQEQVAGPAVVADGNSLNPNIVNPGGEGEKEVKNCYVNCSYISPDKDGGSKSPISAIQNLPLPNGNVDKSENNDESTSSASETETQAPDSSTNPRKRVKGKKEQQGNPKKAKVDSDENSSTSSGQTKKKTTRRSKEPKTKNNADNMSEEQIKKIVENCRESVKDQDPKETEEAYDKALDVEEVSEEKSEQMEIDTEEPQDAEISRKSDKKEKKKSKEKKDKKNRKEKQPVKEFVEEEQEQSDEEVEELTTEQVYIAPTSMFKDAEVKVQQSSVMKDLVRVPDSILRKTCEPFLQDGSCSDVTPKLMKCRECKMTPTQRGKTVPNIFCRFYAFRRLKYSHRGFVTIDGFSELSDAEQDDIDPWIPKSPIIEPKITVQTAHFIIGRLGDKFCELVQQEREAQICAGDDAKIAWKRAVTGVREMCDVCDTTLFNMHWVCHKCGFVVCLDCYNVKQKEEEDESESKGDATSDDEENREWLTCSANRQAHDVDKLMLTQIIPADALWEVGRMLHDTRDRFRILRACSCSPKINKKNGIKTDLMDEAIKHLAPKKKLVNGVGGEKSKTKNGSIKNTVYNPDSSSPLSLLADVASMDSEKARDRSESPLLSKKKEGKNGKSYNPITEPVSPGSSEKKMPPSCSTLRELLTKTAGSKVKNNSESKKKSRNTSSLSDIIQKVVEKQIPNEIDKVDPITTSFRSDHEPEMKLLHYTPRSGVIHKMVRENPIIVHNLTETSVLYPDVPHSWLCDGRLLRLHDPRHKGNLQIFMEQWKRGQPVLVSGVDKHVNSDLWRPEYFSKHFGEFETDLVNCRTSCLVVNQPMKHFWDGFGCLEERLVDDKGTPMLLKLKDWPPGDDFSDILPQQFSDLMQALPLPEYTKRDGHLNLVSRLPDFLVKPDLGPKMYIAYGSARYPKEGTTNLHIDVSDAANVMMFVGYLEDEERGRIPKDQDTNKAIEMARCDPITKRRIREVRETPGALWHIFDAVDADKIRDFLNKVGKERGEKIEQHHDPIHDQSWYLDEVLRDRLADEYNVLCYTILQCLGDSIFVPAGAPHQVRNLNNCIKVAEDFVSPENVQHCFHLTQEFRHLSVGHSNHEDKLQIKNIVYHAIKDATAVLMDASPEDLDM